MDHITSDIDLCRSFPLGCEFMGLFWVSEASDAWRFRSSKALDGDHNTPADVNVVLL